MILFLAACDSAPKEMTNSTAGTETAKSTENQFFGEKIDTNDALTFEELLTKMDEEKSIQTKVTGTVASVCQAKGCWVNIVSEDGREMFVKFKDYAFFLPKDCSGQKVVMEGEAFREITSVDDLRHLAEDGGATPEEIAKITEPKEELKFMASGVVLLASK